MLENIVDTRNTHQLFGLDNYLDDFINLYEKNKMPKVTMLTGKKGQGKQTLINHFLSYVFDNKNYDLEHKKINEKATYLKLYKNDLFENIIYLKGDSVDKVKIDDIRELKSKILKKCSNDLPRYIILDDIELFNKNSLNALLKSIEEPGNNNFFILINNLQVPILETIISRAIEIKFFLNENRSTEIIKNIINLHKLKKTDIDYEMINITPGNFLIFNKICFDNKIVTNVDYLNNTIILFKLFKKTKNRYYVLLAEYILDQFFSKKKLTKSININTLANERLLVTKSINDFLIYNLSQSALINSISKAINE